MRRADDLDPAKLKRVKTGRPLIYSADLILDALGKRKLTSAEWQKRASDETGIGRTKFFELLREAATTKRVKKSSKAEKWSVTKDASPESPETTL